MNFKYFFLILTIIYPVNWLNAAANDDLNQHENAQLSIFERVKQAVTEHPYIALGGLGLASLGFCIIVKHSDFDLSALKNAPSSILQTLKNEAKNVKIMAPELFRLSFMPFHETCAEYVPSEVKDSQVLKHVGKTLGLVVAYCAFGKLMGAPTFSEIFSRDLNRVNDSLLFKEPDGSQIAALKHLIHGWNLQSFNEELFLELGYLELFYNGLINEENKETGDNHLLYAIIVGPVLEECFFTYLPRLLSSDQNQRKFKAVEMAIKFGLMHSQYSIFGKLRLIAMNYTHHQSVEAGYVYSPVIAHIKNNVKSFIFLMAISKAVEMIKKLRN